MDFIIPTKRQKIILKNTIITSDATSGTEVLRPVSSTENVSKWTLNKTKEHTIKMENDPYNAAKFKPLFIIKGWVVQKWIFWKNYQERPKHFLDQTWDLLIADVESDLLT